MHVISNRFSQFCSPYFKHIPLDASWKVSVVSMGREMAAILHRFSENMESISALQGGILAGIHFFNHIKGSPNSFKALISSLMVFKTLDYATLWMVSGPSILSRDQTGKINVHLPYIDNIPQKGIDWGKLFYLVGGVFSFGSFLKTCEIYDFRFLARLSSRIGSVPLFSIAQSVYKVENIPMMGWILHQPYTFCFFIGSFVYFWRSVKTAISFRKKSPCPEIERRHSRVDVSLDFLSNVSKLTEIALSPDSRKSSPFVCLNVIGKQSKLLKTIRLASQKEAGEEKTSVGYSFSGLVLKISNAFSKIRKNADAFQSFCLVNLSLLRISHWKWGTPSFPILDQHLDASQLLDIYEIFSFPRYLFCQPFKKHSWLKIASDCSLFVGRGLMIPFFMEEWGAFKFSSLAKTWGSFRLGSHTFTPCLDDYIKTAFCVGYLFKALQSCTKLKKAMHQKDRPKIIKYSGQILLSTALSLFNLSVLCRSSDKVTNTAMLLGYGLKLIVP